MTTTFEYGYARIRDLEASETRPRRGSKLRIESIHIGPHHVTPTRRFWRSFFTRYGIAENVFRYFDPAEVFQRISERAGDDTFRYCIEQTDRQPGRLLAVSNPDRPVIGHADLRDLVGRYGARDVSYESGVIASTHTPRCGDQTFQIGSDRFQHRFVLETPIDGFGQPRIFLSLLRMICSNGAVGYSRTFRSDINLGKDMTHGLSRAMESFDNGEGYVALRQRLESAQTSWASVSECLRLYKLLGKLHGERQLTHDRLLCDLYRLTGNLNELYGLANLDALSNKRQRVLPSRCRVYDLLNFASEVATHHALPAGSRSLQAYLGALVSDEFDLEGTATNAAEFGDFFVSDDTVGPRPSHN